MPTVPSPPQRASQPAVPPLDAAPGRRQALAWWHRHRGSVLLLVCAAVIGGGLVRLATDQTVVRVVTFDEP